MCMLTRICLYRFEMDNTVVTDFKILCDKNIMLPVVNRNIIISSPIFPQNAFFSPQEHVGNSLFCSFALRFFTRVARAIRLCGSLQKEWREQNERLALSTFSNTRAIRSFYSFYEWAFLKRKLKTGFLSHFLALLRVGNSHFRSLHCLALCSFTLLLLFLLLIALLLLSLFHSRRSFKNSEKSDSIF